MQIQCKVECFTIPATHNRVIRRDKFYSFQLQSIITHLYFRCRMFCFPFQIYHYVWANHRIVENKTMELISRCDFEIQTRPRNLLSSTDNSRQPSKMYDSHASHIVLGRVFIITHTGCALCYLSVKRINLLVYHFNYRRLYDTIYPATHMYCCRTTVKFLIRWFLHFVFHRILCKHSQNGNQVTHSFLENLVVFMRPTTPLACANAFLNIVYGFRVYMGVDEAENKRHNKK